MSSFIKPPFDPEFAEILEQWPANETLTSESISRKRKEVELMWSPEAVLKDPGIKHEELSIPGLAGDIALTVLRSKQSAGGLRPAVYYIHGGGMFLGTRYFLLQSTFEWVKRLDAVLISVEYRLAPEHPSPANLDDCYAGLEWVSSHVSELGIDADKLMIAGGSAGGGLAAGVALLARDRQGPKLCAQLLVYPMIDDRVSTISNKQFETEGPLVGKTNVEAWDLLLPGKRNTEDVSIYAAPSRAKDLSHLPPTFIEVGSAEPFRDEDVAYATKLWECGNQAELHVW
jgi:acetyl esterase/lipase